MNIQKNMNEQKSPEIIPDSCKECKYFKHTGIIDIYRGYCLFYKEDRFSNWPCIARDDTKGLNKKTSKQHTIIKTYRGNQKQATDAFQADILKMEAQGYYPVSQTWAPGSYGCGAFLLALILCLILVGILAFIYMIIVKPDGTLSVTYELRGISKDSDEKTCPMCAETIKAAAIVCRFCGHDFE